MRIVTLASFHGGIWPDDPDDGNDQMDPHSAKEAHSDESIGMTLVQIPSVVERPFRAMSWAVESSRTNGDSTAPLRRRIRELVATRRAEFSATHSKK